MDIKDKALHLIELIAGENESMNENCEFARIYRIAHTAISPNCRKNHPKWTIELEELYKQLKDT